MTSKPIAGKLTDLSKLVEQSTIAKLTDDNEVKFKLVFSHQLEERYNFASMQIMHDPDSKRTLSDTERLALHDLLGECIDTYVGRSVTNVSMHFRRDDENDTAYDPVGGKYQQINHFPIHHTNKARIHGYLNNDGYFVVTRLDWLHTFHPKKTTKLV